jgi:hypothetical protein
MWHWLTRILWRGMATPAAFSATEDKVVAHCSNAVRSAGREAMRDPPERWDVVDQQSDESFPASDPPGNY